MSAGVGVGPVRAAPAPWVSPIPILKKITTDDPVVFLTIDDGFIAPPDLAPLLQQYGWPVSNFVIGKQLVRRPSYFTGIAPTVDFGNHTLSHKYLPGLSRWGMVEEICGGADEVQRLTGHRPTWLRPPGGAFNPRVIEAAVRCGMRALIMWNVTASDGRILVGHPGGLKRGDIIILHYLTSTPRTMRALKTELERLGLRPARLADYLPGVYDDQFVTPTTTTTTRSSRTSSTTTTVPVN